MQFRIYNVLLRRNQAVVQLLLLTLRATWRRAAAPATTPLCAAPRLEVGSLLL